MAKDKNNNNNKVDSKPITNDGRFASVHNDPRFKLPNLNRFKVKVDSRFSKKELEKLSAGSSGKKAKIDRYGRKINDDEKRNLDKFYEHEDEEKSDEEQESKSDNDKKSDESESDDESKDSESDDDDVENVLDRARGEVSGSSSSEDDSDSSDSEDEDEDEVVFEEEESEIELEDTKPEEGDPSDTFAVVNMDWDNLRAVDLMATFLSFVPANGLIKSVTIYPSEFGKEQMQKEEVEGPPRELFKKKSSKKEEDSDSDSDIDVNNADDLEKAARKLYTEDNGEEDYDSKALRRYQLQRLRYYYAIVKCDSVNTAKVIYDNCDGTEYESTANIFDLRYVPEDMDFDDNEAKDSCTKIPASYKPEPNFVTDALQHSKVKLTWDETPKERQNLSSRQFSQKEIDEMDFQAYLASDTEGSDEDENNDAKNKYKSLLGGMSFGKDADKDEEDVDMEITFNPGLDEKAGAAEAKQEEEESTIAAYKRKEKERRKRRMEKFKKEQEENDNEDNSKNNGKNKNNNKNKNNKNNSASDDKSKAELELIMMDEQNNDHSEHFSMRDIVKAEKNKNRKKNKKASHIDSEMTQDSFKPDLSDPRFNEIFENHDYAIDPTSSEFKKTETMKQIMSERSKRHHHHGSGSESKRHKKSSNNSANGSNSEISNMVNKLKRKNKNNNK